MPKAQERESQACWILITIPTQVWTDISMDFVEGLPNSKGKCVIFVAVDRLSKLAHFIPLSHLYSATSIAQVFFQQSLNCMACLKASYVIEMPHSLAFFGESFLTRKKPTSILVLLITHKLTGKSKWSIEQSRYIFVVSQVVGRKSGFA